MPIDGDLTEHGHPYKTNTSMPVRRAYVDAGYGQMHYHFAGEQHKQVVGKTPIVLLHMSSKNARQWRQVLSWLATSSYVVAPDLPGYGESDPPPNDPHVTIDDYGKACWQFIDALDLPSIHLVGIHTGGLVQVAMSHMRPTNIDAMVQFSAPMFSEEELPLLKELYAEPIPLDEEGSRFRLMWERILKYMGPDADKSWAAWSLRDNLMGGEAYEFGHRAAFNYIPEYNEKVLTVIPPMLVINQYDDCYEATKRFHQLSPDACYREMLEWQGSAFLDYNAEAVAQCIKEYFKDL